MKAVDIQSYLNEFKDYDIRSTKDARFVDQKCTPDIVCFISDCILSTSCANKSFTCNDLWDEPYFEKSSRIVFRKPSPNNPEAKNEYNKVLCQPLKLLAYAHVLDVSKIKGVLTFNVRNRDLLEYIATKERNAYNFLLLFFTKVLKDSDLLRLFDEYEENVQRACGATPIIKRAKATIYEKYHKFISGNTPSQSKTDVDRIFHKVFNVICYDRMLPGSKYKINDWYDLMYNRINWRDLGNNKDKGITRQESKKVEEQALNDNVYIEYQIAKACRLVHKMQGSTSEVSDELARGVATEVHHIFPKSQFPELALFFENLILLTSSQHRQKAHPKSNFAYIDDEYQLLCLLSKSKTIEKYLSKIDNGFYSKENFIYVINSGLDKEQIKDANISFDDIRKYLVGYYNTYI